MEIWEEEDREVTLNLRKSVFYGRNDSVNNFKEKMVRSIRIRKNKIRAKILQDFKI